MCIDCKNVACCRDGACPVCTVGQVGAGRGIRVVETGHAASLPDGTGDGTGRNRDRTGTGAGTGRRVVRWLKRFANPNVGNARRMNNGFFDN